MQHTAARRGIQVRLRLTRVLPLFSTLSLSLVCLVALLTLFARTVRAVDCNVPAGYTSIQDAIDEPTCSTIYIAAGVYNENLDIDRDVALIGAGPATTIVDGGALDQVIDINAGYVVISATHIQNGYTESGGAGIDNLGTLLLSDSILSDNYVLGTGFGAGIRNYGVLTVAHSLIRDNVAEDGIVLGGGIYNLGTAWILSDTIISNNTLEASQSFGGGIYNGSVMTISNSIVRNNAITASIAYGAGIDNNAQLTIVDSIVRNNAVDASIGRAGGIHNGGTITVENVNIRNNDGDDYGGGLYNSNELSLLDSRLIENVATDGGGLYGALTTTVSSTTVMSNTASNNGGGIYSRGPLLVQDTSVAHNTATGQGGGLYAGGNGIELQRVTLALNTSSGDGGAIYQREAVVTATNVTISSNEGDGPSSQGGAWYLDDPDASATISSSTIVSNSVTDSANSGGLYLDTAVTVTLENSIVAHNSNFNCQSNGLFTSEGHNLESAADCGLNAAGDISNSDPLLDELALNGGETRTHALLPGSPAVDAGNSAACPVTDQRGVSRDSGAACDIGAYEAVQFSVSDAAQAEGDSGATGMPLTVTLSAASPLAEEVLLSTAAGTATPGADYDDQSSLLLFAPGEVQQTVLITVYGDTVDEQNETFIVTLSDSPGAHVGNDEATGTIVDDDGPQIFISDATVTEGDAGAVTASFAVTLSVASPQSITVDYATAGGSAEGGADYTATSGTLTFTPGITTANIEVDVHGDLLQEPDETFSVELNNATNASIGDGSGAGLILDDDLRLYLPAIFNSP